MIKSDQLALLDPHWLETWGKYLHFEWCWPVVLIHRGIWYCCFFVAIYTSWWCIVQNKNSDVVICESITRSQLHKTLRCVTVVLSIPKILFHWKKEANTIAMRDPFLSHLLLFFLPDSPNSNWRSREGLRSESRILMQNPNKRNVPSFKFNNKVKNRFWHLHKDNCIKGCKSDGLLKVRVSFKSAILCLALEII